MCTPPCRLPRIHNLPPSSYHKLVHISTHKPYPIFHPRFLQVLRELSIPCKMCDGDNTSVILGMSRDMGCSVMSRDSAYFLHDIPQGYVPMHRVQAEDNSLTFKVRISSEIQRQISSQNEWQVYQNRSLAGILSLKPELLSLWSALAGSLIGHEEAIGLFRRCVGYTSHLPRHTSHVTSYTSHVTRQSAHATSHTSSVTVTRHASHVTRHTSHVTRHTSHVTRHTLNHRRHITDAFQYEADDCRASHSMFHGIAEWLNQ